MALEGKLSDFGFAEILQLVETQQKSGFLTLTGRITLVFAFVLPTEEVSSAISLSDAVDYAIPADSIL